MIRPVAALVTSAALSILGPAGAAAAMHPTPGPASAAAPDARAEQVSRQAPRQAPGNAEEGDRFAITIDRISPSAVPRKGPITMSGRVTNNTETPAKDVNIHPLTSYSPMTTTEEITAATEASPEVYWGDRIITAGSFATLDRLAPGDTRRWKLEIPQADLDISGLQGVYQIGVQVRAPSKGGDRVTVGRARTLIPLVNRDTATVRTSVVVPVRNLVAHDAEGRLVNPQAWARTLSAGGRLRNIADFAARSGGTPFTWLIDPAVLDAVQQVSEGSPARVLDPTDGEEPEIETEEPELAQASPEAEAWLSDMVADASTREVLALPYGDIDVAAVQRSAEPLYARARTLSARTFSGLDIESTPAVAPATGLLPTAALDLLESSTRVLLSSEALPTDEDISVADTPSYLETGNHRVALADAGAANTPSGTPSAVAVRQRVLSEAAVRALSGSKESLVVNLPSDFDPGRRPRAFFRGIDRDFIDLVPLAGNGAGTVEHVDRLDYPEDERQDELGVNALIAADGLVRAGAALDGILTRTDQVQRQVTGEALTTISYAARATPDKAMARAHAATERIRGLLGLVTVDAPSFVILSAESGPFAATVTNELDQPITVALEARTPGDVEIEGPETIDLEANSSQTIQLNARTSNIGVHSIELLVTDAGGNELGSSDRVSVRSNTVGKVIWVILAVGVGILFVAIPLRWVRRIRAGRSE